MQSARAANAARRALRGIEDEGTLSAAARLSAILPNKRKLEQVLNIVRENPGLVETNKRELTAHTYALFQDVAVVEELAMCDGSPYRWTYCHPNVMVARVLETSPNLRRLLCSAPAGASM